MHSTKTLIVGLVMAVSACSLWDGGAAEDAADTEALASDSVAAAAGNPALPALDTEVRAEPGPAAAVDSVGGPEASATDSTGSLASASQDGAQTLGPDGVTRLLAQIAASQMAMERRLDTLAARVGGPARTAGTVGTVAEGRSDGGAGAIVDAAGDTAVNLGLGVAWSAILIVLVRLMIGGLVWFLETLAEQYPRSRLLWKRLVPVVRIVLWAVLAVFIVRVVFRVDASNLLAAAAATGVAVAFAAQDLLKNVFGGLILVFDQPFQVGDKISVAGTYGEVVSIGLRSTRIVTPDDNLVSVPNAQVVDGQVANANAGQLNCQVVTDLYLPGVVNEAVAKKIAFDAAASSKYVFLNKPIVVLVKDEFKETFLTHLKVKAYVLDPRYEFMFQSDVTERARAGFREAGLMSASQGMRAWLDLSQVGIPNGEAGVMDGTPTPVAAGPDGQSPTTEADGDRDRSGAEAHD